MPQPLRDGELTIALGGFKDKEAAREWASDPRSGEIRHGLVVKDYDVKIDSTQPLGWSKKTGASVWRK
jgi:hypothetical protein